MFRLEFNTDNAAFGDDPDPEIIRILRATADRIELLGICNDNDPFSIRDENGGTIGECVLTRSTDSDSEAERAVRAAWNNYVFARAGVPPGPRMKLVSEADAFEKLSEAFHKLTAVWDAR